MPNKQKTTYQKRQRELARQDKQRKKFERRMERRLLKAQRGAQSGLPDVETPETPVAAAEPDPAAGQ